MVVLRSTKAFSQYQSRRAPSPDSAHHWLCRGISRTARATHRWQHSSRWQAPPKLSGIDMRLF